MGRCTARLHRPKGFNFKSMQGKVSRRGRLGEGGPTKYKPEYCEAIIKFFSKPTTQKIQLGDKMIEKPCRTPYFEDFADTIGVDDNTLGNWCVKFPEFLGAYNKAKHLQKHFLIENGLAGHYPPASFIFVAKNITDMKDKSDMDLTSGGKPLSELLLAAKKTGN